MKSNWQTASDRTLFNTRSSLFMPILFVTQMNVGIYWVFGGPAINRLFDVRANVLIMRQLVCLLILLCASLLMRKFNFKKATYKDWKYTILSGNIIHY
jgi:hypothetical protein